MRKHTPEPWVAIDRAIKRDNGFGYGEIVANVPGGNTSGPFFVQSDEECEANARLIVACVNACAGMEDPAAEIAELKRQRDELLGLIKCVAYHSISVTVSGVKCAAFPWSEYEAIINKAKGGAE